MATNNAINQTGVGFHSLTSSGVYNARSIAGTANQITITNGDGTAGNPITSANNTNDFMACATAVGISQTTPYPVSSSYASNYVQANQTFANCSAVTTGGSVSGYAVSTSAAHFSINVIIEV